jgi:hypothetical protein
MSARSPALCRYQPGDPSDGTGRRRRPAQRPRRPHGRRASPPRAGSGPLRGPDKGPRPRRRPVGHRPEPGQPERGLAGNPRAGRRCRRNAERWPSRIRDAEARVWLPGTSGDRVPGSARVTDRRFTAVEARVVKAVRITIINRIYSVGTMPRGGNPRIPVWTPPDLVDRILDRFAVYSHSRGGAREGRAWRFLRPCGTADAPACS